MIVGKDDPIGETDPSLSASRIRSSAKCAAPTCRVLSSRYRRYTKSCRVAIALTPRLLEIGPGDKVLVPTYHCPTMIAPVVQCGAEPMFYPITASGSVDLDWLQSAALGGARALLAAHFFGIPQPMSGVRSFCDAHRIALIEDCAHAYFGVSEGGWPWEVGGTL